MPVKQLFGISKKETFHFGKREISSVRIVPYTHTHKKVFKRFQIIEVAFLLAYSVWSQLLSVSI